MLNVTMSIPGIETVVQQIEALKAINLTPVADSLADALYQENIYARSEGVGGSGLDLMEIKESTIKRRRRAGKGMGPPLAPDDVGSSVITGFETRVEQTGELSWLVIGEWNAPWLHYHVTGTKWMPARDIVGFRPVFREKAAEIFHAQVSELLGGRA
jgi:hypothetical protein